MMNRRELLRSAAAGAAALALPGLARADDVKGFALPKLPYPADALEPIIDAKTMEIHHGKHHQTYVDNLNKALAGKPDLLGKPIAELVRDWKKLPENLQAPVRNNGGGHLNHTWFWQMMKKDGGAPGANWRRPSTPRSVPSTGSRRSSRRPRCRSSAAGGRGW
jgi:Fe-Mn family superoxide dismutase